MAPKILVTAKTLPQTEGGCKAPLLEGSSSCVVDRRADGEKTGGCIGQVAAESADGIAAVDYWCCSDRCRKGYDNDEKTLPGHADLLLPRVGAVATLPGYRWRLMSGGILCVFLSDFDHAVGVDLKHVPASRAVSTRSERTVELQ